MIDRRFLRFIATSLLAFGITSCAEERDPINRVQANALDKSFFVGDIADDEDDPAFFARHFVVDTSQSQELVGISQSSGLERIRWDITENMLFARRAYSVVEGGTGEPDEDYIAAYKIESHFDIRHAYNPSTGEELNVIEEISSDRPWNERQYFRVDWSENLVNSPSWTTMFYGQVFGDIELTPVSYFESDPNSDDAPHFEAEEGYFDITSHFLVEPASVNLGWFELPTCMLMGLFTGSAIYSCDPQEAVIRSSYWRVDEADPDDDFEPFENTSSPLDVFGNPGGIGDSASLGIVTPARLTYDPQYGFTDESLERYMNIHDIWAQSHQTTGACEQDSDCNSVGSGSVCLASGACTVPCRYEAKGDSDGNGTDDQCENSDTDYQGSEGAQCSARNRCTIPYRDRQVDSIEYWVNPEMPDELQDEFDGDEVTKRGPSEELIFTWNQALELAVARAREVECRRTDDGSRQECHNEFFETQGGRDQIQMIAHGGWGVETPKEDTEVLVLCHNPVRSYDPEGCGEEGTRARVGDVRRNFLIYWPYATQAPYGGIGNWRGDPLTGQILGAAATTIGRSATISAAQVRDIAMVGIGEIELEDILDGANAYRYAKVLRDGRKPEAMSKQEIERRLASIDNDHLAEQAHFDLKGVNVESPKQALLEVKANTLANGGGATQELLELQAAMKPLLDTELEAQLLDPNWLVDATGLSPNTQLSQAILDLSSPLRGQDLGHLSLLDRQFFTELGLRGICHLEGMAPAGNPDLYGVGHYYRQKYRSASRDELADRMYEDLWKETYKGIQLHEIGHSLGLLHNFTSSYDAQNYDPQYWQLRTHEGNSTASCEGEPRTGNTSSVGNDTCMGPRYLDPETDDELGKGDEPRPGIVYFGHTSTMEYQNSRFFESIGLGQYDVMAMGAMYGRVLQTYDADQMSQSRQAEFERFPDTQLTESITTTDFSGRHYTELARELNLFDASRCRAATNAEKEVAEWRIVHDKICTPPRKDYGHWDDFVDYSDPNLSMRADLQAPKMRILGGRQVPAAGNVRWFYRFGGDLMNSYLHVNPFDSGADPYEVTMETLRKNEYNYPFIYYRRARRDWTSWRLPSYTARMFYERLRSYHWDISYTNAFYNDITNEAPIYGDFFDVLRNDDNELRPYLLAESKMIDGIIGNLLVPEPGVYGQTAREDTGVFDLQGITEDGSLFTLDVGEARYLAPAYDSGPAGGGSWLYQDFVRRAGYSVEKQLAARALTDGRAVFFSVSRDIYLDNRNVNINFRSDFPQGVDRILGGMLAEDWTTISPYIMGANEPEVTYRDITSESPAPLPDGARQVFPNIGYNHQVPAMIYAFLFGRRNGDLTLANKLRIWIEGNLGAEFDIPEAEQVRFTDPTSGITYVARRYGPETLYGKEVDKGIASRMLAHANELLSQVYEVEVDEDGNPVIDEFGRPSLARNEDGFVIPLEDDLQAPGRFRRYVGLLDANVQLSALLGHGPNNWF